MSITRRSVLKLVTAGSLAATAMTAAGGTMAMAGPQEALELELVNPGFEEPMTAGTIPGWEQIRGTTGFSLSDQAIEGEQALVVRNSEEVVGLLSSAVGVVPGRYYAATVQGLWTTGRPQLYLYFYNEDGKQLAESNRSFTGMEPGEWYWYGIGAHAPAGAVEARVMIYSAIRPADFVVDDVRIIETHGRVEAVGHAAEEVATIGMTNVGDKYYVTTRNQIPAVLGEYDLATGELTGLWELPGSEGSWALTAGDAVVHIMGYPSGKLHSLDLTTREVASFPAFGGSDTMVYGVELAEDGNLYCVTYPDCGVWRISPDTGDANRIARVGEGEAYARCLASEGTDLVVGTSPGGRLYHVDVTTETVTEITPDIDRASGFVTCAIHESTVWAANAERVVSLALDGTDPRTWDLPGSQIDTLRVMPTDGAVCAVIRPTGAVHRMLPDEDDFTDLGAGAPGEEHRNVVATADGIVGLGGNGNLWSWSPAEGFVPHHLHDTDLKGPTLLQAMCAMPNGMVAVSGSDVHVHRRPGSGDAPVFIPIPATPIRLAATRDALWVATYPRTEIIRIPVGTWKPEVLGRISNGQYRPWDARIDQERDSLVISTQPSLGKSAGAITLFGLSSHEFTIFDAPLGEQTITQSIALGSRTFLCGGMAEDNRAKVGEIDLDTGELLWSTVPVAGGRTIESIVHHDGILYGVVRGNRWFALDLASGDVVRTGWLSGTHSYGILRVFQGRIVLPTHKGMIFELDLARRDALLLLDGLDEGWRRAPQYWCDDRTGRVWGMDGTELARFDLTGTHLPD